MTPINRERERERERESTAVMSGYISANCPNIVRKIEVNMKILIVFVWILVVQAVTGQYDCRIRFRLVFAACVFTGKSSVGN